jgi:hypothetical protein
MTISVGIDVHRRRSQVAVIDATGGQLSNRKVTHRPQDVLAAIGDALAGTAVAFEAGYGWSWLVDLLEDADYPPTIASTRVSIDGRRAGQGRVRDARARRCGDHSHGLPAHDGRAAPRGEAGLTALLVGGGQ